MRTLLTALFVVAMAVPVNAQDNELLMRVDKAIYSQMQRFPSSTLRDIYKNFFHDYFGVAHMIGDTAQVRRYIIDELSAADTLDAAYYEPCGYNNNFYRVNLSAVRDGLITADELVNAFISSLPYSRIQMDAQWTTEWSMIESRVHIHFPHIKGYAADSQFISDNLSRGIYVMHHSEEYSRAYHPHYRVVYKEVFLDSLLPRLLK